MNMNEKKMKKKYETDEDIIAMLQQRSAAVAPGEAALRSVLANLDRSSEESVPSPYMAPTRSFFSLKKAAITMLLLVLMVGGGALYTHQTAPVPAPQQLAVLTPEATTLSNDTSDAGLDQDIQAIDTQMQGLDSDVSAAETPSLN